MQNKSRIKCQRGFTLLELLAVLLLIAIVFGVATFYMQGQGRRVRGVAYDLTHDLQSTASLAIRDSQIYRLRFEDENKGYVIEEFEPKRPPPSEKDVAAYQKWQDEQRALDALSPDERKARTSLDFGNFREVKKRAFPGSVEVVNFLCTRIINQNLNSSDKKDHPERDLLFFPTGETDQALIVIDDGSHHPFSLELNPLTGRVTARVGETTEADWKKELGL